MQQLSTSLINIGIQKIFKTLKRDGDIIAVHTHSKQQSYRSKIYEPKIKQVLDLINKDPKKINWLDMGVVMVNFNFKK